MSLTKRYNYIFYMSTLGLALILKILPSPPSIQNLAPDWVLLVLIYWLLSEPHKIGIFNAFFIGLLVDVIPGRLLGQYSLGYIFAAYLCLKLHNRLQNVRLAQQGFIIFLILIISQSILLWTETIQHARLHDLNFWLPALTGALCWPLVKYLLNHSQRWFN